jgi:threonine synthase
MHYYSTRNKNDSVDFATAALTGLAPDGGLFIPEEIPLYPTAVKKSLGSMDFYDIAFETIKPYVYPEIPNTVLEDIVHSAYPFNAPLICAGDRQVLELFHGPTAAFKDFGARFMARAFSYLRRGETKPLHILVATSGDTGGAVADGFFGVEGISVTVLFPRGRVSPLQERQIAGLGGNISALAVEGSFDDCQRLVKAALNDETLRKRMVLSSANSINVSRLIPQAVYYAAAAGKAFLGKVDADGEATPRDKSGANADIDAIGGADGWTNADTFRGADSRGIDAAAFGASAYRVSAGQPISFCVPSGNFGNLTAGLYAMKMGAPIARFIAATNANKTVPDYLASGDYETRPSQATISNAMDVGAPSNFERMTAHFSWEEMKRTILGVSVTDEETRETINAVHTKYAYFLDPHSAVGWKAADKLAAAGLLAASPLGILSTAHPAKFTETVEPAAGTVPVPKSLASAMKRKPDFRTINADLNILIDSL